MTISEATHAMATLHQQRPESAAPPMRIVDAISRVEPTWVEAVAVVQAVCAQLEPGQAAPPLDTIMITSGGEVSFPPAGSADAVSTVGAAGKLLAGILRTGDCPMPLWEAMEAARRSPKRVGSARAFGRSLTCFPAAQGPHELAQYYQAARRLAPLSARPATAPFALSGLTARAIGVLLLVSLCGVAAGIGMGVVVATRTAPAPAGIEDARAASPPPPVS
ncbi:MAG: hypothetical protein R2745_04995 [Vicinamibacterales bacterium]